MKSNGPIETASSQMQLAEPEQANDANQNQINRHNVVEQPGSDQNQNAGDDRKDWRNGQVKVHEVTPDLKGRITQITNSFGGTDHCSLGSGVRGSVWRPGGRTHAQMLHRGSWQLDMAFRLQLKWPPSAPAWRSKSCRRKARVENPSNTVSYNCGRMLPWSGPPRKGRDLEQRPLVVDQVGTQITKVQRRSARPPMEGVAHVTPGSFTGSLCPGT